MRVVKQIVGILLATVGAVFTGSFVLAVFDKEPIDWAPMLFIALLAIAPLTGAFFLLKPKRGELASTGCPNCGSTRITAAALASHSPLWVLFLIPILGWVMAALWGGTKKRQVRCNDCQTAYFSQSSASYVGRILLWVFALFLLLAIIAYTFDIK